MNFSLAYPVPSQMINSHVFTAQTRSVEWAERFALIHGEKQKHHLHRSKIAWLVGRAFPEASLEGLQVASDWTTLFCLLDDRIEDPLLHPIEASMLLSKWLEAFRSGVASQDPISEAFADLHHRMKPASQSFVLFLSRLEELCLCFSWEAIHRRQGVTPDLETYLHMREISVGLYAEFALSGFTDGLELPSKVLSHPSLQRLMSLASRAVGCANDLFTYEKELQQGELHNLVHVLMTRQALTKEEAIDRAVKIHDDAVREFFISLQKIPSFEEHDLSVHRFVSILQSWMVGHLEWAKETGRYQPTYH
jgi:hypothetical protein